MMKELELFIYSMENRIKLTRFILKELLLRHCLQESSRSEATYLPHMMSIVICIKVFNICIEIRYQLCFTLYSLFVIIYILF